MRDGADIKSDWYISISDAILGGTANVKTIHGKSKIEILPGSVDGTKHTLKKQGFN